jgi:hypothetical protein
MLPPRVCRSIAVILLFATLASCSSMSPRSCLAGQEAAVQELLYFGADKPSGRVTPEDWSGFLAETVTPRFPQGLTAWQASGQWRSASGGIVREPSHVLSLVHPANAASESAIREIVDAYKSRFQQEAVLRVRSDVCMAL